MSTGGFSNPVAGGGGTLIRTNVHSPNFVSGASGWSIDQDGSAEFNNVIIRGTLTLPSQYQARMTDMLVSPGFGSINTFVVFTLGEFDPCILKTASNSATVTIGFDGYNNNTATSTLRLAVQTESSADGNPPWILENTFDIDDSAVVTNSGAGSLGFQQGFSSIVFYDGFASTTPAPRPLTSDLAARPFIRIRAGWRISSGGPATATIDRARLTVTPGF
jgi:hypothetical protein